MRCSWKILRSTWKFNVRTLERAGFQVSCDVVSMPEDLATRLRSSRYDVVLSDYRLQGWSGIETLKLVREHCPSTPVVIVTEHSATKWQLNA